jgi:spore coat polysaccharide biosynthesis protein SpsF
MNILAITQARTGSTRLPNKVLKTINGETLLNIHIKRILKSRLIDQLVIATTIADEDAAIVTIAKQNNLPFYQGSVANVLDRFYQCAKAFNPTWVVRLTSDCPLIDPALIDTLIAYAINNDIDYCSNSLNPTFPDGIDIEVFRFSALEKAWNEAKLDSEKEHVTPYIYKNSTFNNQHVFQALNFSNPISYAHVRLTVDEPEDFEVVKIIIENLGTDKDWKTYADFYLANNKIQLLNKQYKRNEGYTKSLKDDNNGK